MFLAANPKDTSQLRLDEEMRGIDQALRQSEFRDDFDIEQNWAVRIVDLQGYLLRHKPNIVHFSGHGSASSEIILEDSSGNSQPISSRALSQLFALLKDNIRCVVLNACYSEQQAKAIAEHIDCVIGMSKAIGDSAAISFAIAFYQALGYGRDIKTAFDLGCLQINLENLNEQDTPNLLAINSNPNELVLVKRIPKYSLYDSTVNTSPALEGSKPIIDESAHTKKSPNQKFKPHDTLPSKNISNQIKVELEGKKDQFKNLLSKAKNKQKNREGKIAVTAILLGNIASILGSLQTINNIVSNMISYRFVEQLYDNMRIIVALIFFVGYALGFYWLYRKFLLPEEGRNKPLLIAIGILVMVGLFFTNVALLPSPPRPEPILRDKVNQWVERICSSQANNGGIRAHALDPSTLPQVWTTAQCLKGVLTARYDLEKYKSNIKNAFEYIERSRRTSPYDGWGLYEEREWTVTEIASWVAVASIASVDPEIQIWDEHELPRILDRIERDLEHIVERQSSTGGWSTISEVKPEFTRTYSTVMALWSLIEARRLPIVQKRVGYRYDTNIRNGINWLLGTYDKNLGWVPNPNRGSQTERFCGLSAQVLFVMSRAERDFRFLLSEPVYLLAKKNFIELDELAKRPVAFNNRVHDADQTFRPTTFHLESSTHLWFPWSFVTLTYLSTDTALSENERKSAAKLRLELSSKVDELHQNIGAEFMYVAAESLFCISFGLQSSKN